MVDLPNRDAGGDSTAYHVNPVLLQASPIQGRVRNRERVMHLISDDSKVSHRFFS
ncbi:hypothetical protein VCR4J2_260085 [Vibrio coralliirubri]|nr:hypothetical protein VCR4J2_260085 [Vibrio coralliirubri]